LEEAVKLIRGKEGTEVTLSLYREGKSDTFDVTLTRDEINVPGLELEWKESGGRKIAWIKFYKFSEQVFTEWQEVVNKIKAEKGDNYGGIVLDLRNNPGGYLQASVMVASDFIKEGVVVKQESSSGQVDTYTVDKSRLGLLDDKLVVLINGGSASAAEILAGALRDHNRAKLVGEKSFGKGTVQQPEDFSDGSGLHVTIARWLLPSGGNIHKIGISPDVESIYEEPKISSNSASKTTTKLELPDNQLDKAIEVLLGK
jgi:carboxyl-terminal processing protease